MRVRPMTPTGDARMADQDGEDHATQREKRIREAAERAKAEADARRKGIDSVGEALPREVNGRNGPEPIRFGDWEVDGRATDF